MARFRPKTVITLKREEPSPNITRGKKEPSFWYLTRGNIKKGFWGLYRTLQAAYTTGMLPNKEQIWKIEIAVFRRK